MKHGSSKDELVLNFVRSTDISALHSDEAKHHSKEAKSDPTHEQSTDALDESYGTTGRTGSNGEESIPAAQHSTECRNETHYKLTNDPKGSFV